MLGRPHSPRPPHQRLGLLLGLLAVNLAPYPWGTATAWAGALGWALVHPPRHRLRLLGLLWGYALVGGAAIAWIGDPTRGLALGLRLGAAALASSCFAQELEWAALRRGLQRWRTPEPFLELLDQGFLHGRLLARALARRQEAARMRGGGLEGHAMALAGGIALAFERSERLDAAARLRGTQPAAELPPASEAPALQLAQVCVRFEEGGEGLSGLDLQVERNEWLAILGPSGSGKSTLLRTAAGLLKPQGGTLQRFGADGRGRLDGHTGLVFQDPEDQLLGATPEEDTAWGLRRRGLSPETASTLSLELLQALGMGSCATRLLSRLSHGERKRAALAATLALEPHLLLCDEPTTGLDPLNAQKVVALLETHARNCAVLWATHDLAHLPSRISRVLILNQGRPVFLGPRALALDPERLRSFGLLCPEPI